MKIPDFKDLILFENSDYIVINKPPYLATLEDRTLFSSNILRLAKEYDPDAQVGHRLDKETSGALAIARNPEAYRHLAMQFEAREVDKIYHAVVWGLHDYDGIAVDRNLLTNAKGIVKVDRTGKSALTFFRTIASYRHHTLMECKPVTGRMHQIRVHLAYV
ncbi:MAG: RNA pseudouridine synthase, partial [Chitinophagaceae bacterium]